MSAFLKEVQDLEDTLRQINIEKSSLIEHLKNQDEHFNSVVKDLQSVYSAKIEKKIAIRGSKTKFCTDKI